MREIKFRQHVRTERQKYMGQFHYWGFIDGGFVAPLGKNDVDGASEQYTGLTDANGVDIYFDDVVYVAGYGDMHVSGLGDLCTLIGAAGEGDIGTIKGNIHQNPELLK